MEPTLYGTPRHLLMPNQLADSMQLFGMGDYSEAALQRDALQGMGALETTGNFISPLAGSEGPGAGNFLSAPSVRHLMSPAAISGPQSFGAMSPSLMAAADAGAGNFLSPSSVRHLMSPAAISGPQNFGAMVHSMNPGSGLGMVEGSGGILGLLMLGAAAYGAYHLFTSSQSKGGGRPMQFSERAEFAI